MHVSLVEIQCRDFSVVSCSSKSININSTLLKHISYNNLPILFACSSHYLLFIYSLTGPLMVESLTIESLTVESPMVKSLTVALQASLNRLQACPNRLQLNCLRSNRLQCYADRLCNRVLLGHCIYLFSLPKSLKYKHKYLTQNYFISKL